MVPALEDLAWLRGLCSAQAEAILPARRGRAREAPLAWRCSSLFSQLKRLMAPSACAWGLSWWTSSVLTCGLAGQGGL